MSQLKFLWGQVGWEDGAGGGFVSELELLKYEHVVVCLAVPLHPSYSYLLLVSFRGAVVNSSDWTAPNIVAEWTDMTRYLQDDLMLKGTR